MNFTCTRNGGEEEMKHLALVAMFAFALASFGYAQPASQSEAATTASLRARAGMTSGAQMRRTHRREGMTSAPRAWRNDQGTSAPAGARMKRERKQEGQN